MKATSSKQADNTVVSVPQTRKATQNKIAPKKANQKAKSSKQATNTKHTKKQVKKKIETAFVNRVISEDIDDIIKAFAGNHSRHNLLY